MTDYIPVNCSLHSEYGLAIMHRDRLKPGWRDASGDICIATNTLPDLRTRNSEEFWL